MKQLKILRLVWSTINVKHIARHDVSPSEVEEVIESKIMVREGRDGRYIVIGATPDLRVLTIILEEIEEGAFFPVTAYPASRRMRREYKVFRRNMMTNQEIRLQELEQLKNMTREEVAAFWDTHDVADYWEFMTPVEVVQTPKQAMSLRMDQADIERLKEIAQKHGIGATTLARMVLKSFLDNPDSLNIVGK